MSLDPIGDSARRTAMFRMMLTLTATMALTTGAARGEVEIEVGRPFPVMTMPSLADGRPTSIAEHRGQKLILHIFAAW